MNSTQILKTDFYIEIVVKLRKCLKGEIHLINNLYESCEECKQKEFSLKDPNVSTEVNCLQCLKNANCPGKDQLDILPG